MRSSTSSFRCVGMLGCLIGCIILWATEPVCAQQEESNPRPPVYIERGATVAGDWIRADAARMIGYGQMLESAAIARKINADAVTKEIENHKLFVQTWFELRDFNKEQWRKEHPDEVTRWARRLEKMRELVKQREHVLKNDPTAILNWLLDEVSGPALASQYLPAGQTLLESGLDQKLTPSDLERIWLTDGRSPANRIEINAAKGKPLQTDSWPLGLRDSKFDTVRANFEGSRDNFVEEMTSGHVSDESRKNMIKSIEALFNALDDAYPERRQDQAKYWEYTAARHYVAALQVATNRLSVTNDSRAVTGDYRFQGDTVVGLVRHMYENGLKFAPRKPGSEGVQEKLYKTLLGLFERFGPDESSGNTPKRAGVGT